MLRSRTSEKRKPKIIKDKKERGEWAESVLCAGGGKRFAVSKPVGDSRRF